MKHQITALNESDESQNTVIARHSREIYNVRHRVTKIEINPNSVPIEEYNQVCKKLIESKNELKQTQRIVSDVSFKADYKPKQLDKSQTQLDDFIEY